jgi:hypothetical protein
MNEGARRAGLPALLALSVLASLPACSSEDAPAPLPDAPAEAPETAEQPPALPEPPWRGARLPVTAVPEAYLSAWRKAENRETCALVVVADSTLLAEATPRTATFSGGWGVAYDQPRLRGAFGVAGTGSSAAEPAYDAWPHWLEWADGSSAGYGPEGGTGPNQLAYLTIQGQGCLYNVWSRLGQSHLERLLGALRLVATEGITP